MEKVWFLPGVSEEATRLQPPSKPEERPLTLRPEHDSSPRRHARHRHERPGKEVLAEVVAATAGGEVPERRVATHPLGAEAPDTAKVEREVVTRQLGLEVPAMAK